LIRIDRVGIALTPSACACPAALQGGRAGAIPPAHWSISTGSKPPPHQRIDAVPEQRSHEIWILGSSDYGAQLAALLGLPYAFAYFFMDGQGVEQALGLYRQLYRPSARHPMPQATICVWAMVADSTEEAQHLALSRDRWRLDRQRGRLGPLRWPDEIAAAGFDANELAQLAPMRSRAFVGTADAVAEQLSQLAVELQLDELVVNTWACDPAARRRSYALLAQAFELAP
jgi:luciferase family oxidoreductase group 1